MTASTWHFEQINQLIKTLCSRVQVKMRIIGLQLILRPSKHLSKARLIKSKYLMSQEFQTYKEKRKR